MSGNAARLNLLPRELLVRTSPVDRADWNYGGILGFVSRQRFRLAASLLPQRPLDRVLEIGYGSGVFLPTLLERAARVSGIDTHERAMEITAALAVAGISADLLTAPSERLPFDDAAFDAVVAVSALEFVADLDATLTEISRVLRPGGRAVVVTPGDHPLLDLALRVLTGASARRDFGDRRGRVVAAIETNMRVVARARFPAFGPIAIYRAFALEAPTGERPGAHGTV